MKTEEKRSIKSTILECREVLEKDIEQVLINYGIYVDKVWINIDDLENLTEEQKFTRGKIENVIAKYEKGGFSKDKAVKEYIKEVSYTYLNRLAALRVMEVRGLIDEILIPRNEYGNRSFMSSRFYEVAREYCKYQMDGGLSFLLTLVFEEISKEINMLFNMEDEYSLIFPSNEALLEVIQLLCNEIDEESWKQDEIIGWIYQYFNDKEKDDVFDRLYNKKEKIKVEDIPAATQLFTPDWIVDWIVDNSLGTLWQEIKEGKREYEGIEEIKEIKLLDPCCGSGHFLVKAYDLFYQMYKEEGYNEEEIPFLILEHNIYGIDIDLRAVQLTGLILYIKTKTYLKQGGFDTNIKGKMQVNLVCADAILLNGTRLEALKEKHKDNKYVLEMIDIIYEEFEDVRLKGSLIQPEKRLRPLKEKAIEEDNKNKEAKSKRIAKKQEKNQIDMLGNFDDYDMGKSFSRADVELAESLKLIYQEAVKANDMSRQLFANEATKSVQLVNIFMKEYDVVVTNPPYMGKRSMNSKLKGFVDKNYKISSSDLYSLFIDRCLEFLDNDGLLGMITQQSFMFINTYQKFRDKLLFNYRLKRVVQVGSRAFDDISGEKVNTTMFIIENNKKKKSGEYCRLIKYDTPESKKENLTREKNWYKCNQDEFHKIEGKPFVFWISDNMRELFNENKPLGDVVHIKQGLATGDNARFVRYFWEVKTDSIGSRWRRYCKGAGFRQYYGGIDSIVLWEEDGKEIKNFINPKTKKLRSRPQNEEFYFREGITYSLIGGSGFSARYLPEGCIFDVGGSCIFTDNDNISIYYTLGLLNTEFTSYVLSLLNPTLNFQVGDLKRVPFIFPEKEMKEKLEYYAQKCVSFYKKIESLDENTVDFHFPELLVSKGNNLVLSFNNYIKKRYFDELEYCYNKQKTEILVREIYKLNEEDIELIEDEFGELPFDIKMTRSIDNIDINLKQDFKEFIHEINSKEKDSSINGEKKEEFLNQFILGENLYLLSKKFNMNPLDIIDDIRNINVKNTSILKTYVEKLLSFYLGLIFGRYNPYEIAIKDDGILPIDSTIYTDSFIEKIYECIEVTYGEENMDIVLDEMEEILGRKIEEYMIKEFFDFHKKIFQKRPIYWHICSPKKTFNCFVYYHKLDKDTLYKVKGIYLREMIDRYKDDLEYYNDQLIEARLNEDKKKEKDFRARVKDLEEKLEDLYELDKMLMEIAPSYKPDLDEGVLYNIIPVEPILSSKVSTARERENYYKEVEKQ